MSPVFRAFGPIAVDVDGSEITLSQRRERDVLGVLLAAQGSPVSADRLLAELWGDRIGTSSTAPVQVAVSRLRALLDPGRSASRSTGRVVRSAAGYQLRAERDEVDVWVFESLVEQALTGSTPRTRLAAATRAAELSQGTPYAGCQVPSVQAEAARLEELRVVVEQVRAESLLELGHALAADRLLAPLARQHPYREQLWALLGRAQYASGRQADALATLATLRTRLAEDLGVDPTPGLRAMEQAILRQDPRLGAGVTVTGRGHRPSRVRCRSHRVSTATSSTTAAPPSSHSAVSEVIQARSTARPMVT